jgi:MFS family permease
MADKSPRKVWLGFNVPLKTKGVFVTSYEASPLAGNSDQGFFYGYVIVALAFLILTIVGGVQYTFGVFFKPLSNEFGWTSAATSGAFSTYMVVGGFFTMIFSKLNDKFGPRVILTISGFFLGMGLILMSQASAIWHLYLFYGIFVSMGMSGAYFPLMSTLARWFVKKRGMMTGIATSGVGVGTMLMPPFASWLISGYSWNTSYTVMGIIGWVVFITAAQFLRRDPARRQQRPYGYNDVLLESPGAEVEGFSLRETVHTVQFWLFCLVYLLFGICSLAIMVHIVPHAIYLDISAMEAATILTVIGGLGIVGRVVMGSAGDRIGSRMVIVMGLVLTTAALAWLLIADEMWMFYLFAAVFGFSYSGVVILESPLVAELFGLKSHGAILGIIGFVSIIGGAIGSLLAGWLFDITESYNLAFLIFIMISFVSMITAYFLKPVRGGIKNESSRSA